LQIEFLAGESRIYLGQFLLSEIPGCGVGILRQLAGNRRISLERDKTAIAFHQRPQPRVLHRQLAELILAPNDARVRQKPADFLEPLIEFFQFSPDGVFHGREL
jgi:hypothetical protein